MDTDRNAATVVLDTQAIVSMNGDLDLITESGHGLINTVVHHLVNKMMKSGNIDIADIHRGSSPDRL